MDMPSQKNYNASSSAFGWDFQCNAAIILMIKHIKDAKAVRVEGHEDIEIYLENDKIIFAQCKSISSENDERHINRNLKEALKTLNCDADNPKAQKLYYITNTDNPFKLIDNKNTFYGDSIVPYNDLPSNCKDKINKLVNDNGYKSFDSKKDLFIVRTFPFIGSDLDNRYKVIKESVNELLEMIGAGERSLGKRVLDVWQNKFQHNSTQKDLNIRITKEKLIWPIIVCFCDVNGKESVLIQCDEGELNQIEEEYKEIVNNESDNFQLFNKVINDYVDYIDINGTNIESINDFIRNNWKRYEKEIPDVELKEVLIKLILYKILYRRREYNRIKKVVNL